MTDQNIDLKAKSLQELADEEIAKVEAFKARRVADAQALVDRERSFVGFVKQYKWEIITLVLLLTSVVLLAKHAH